MISVKSIKFFTEPQTCIMSVFKRAVNTTTYCLEVTSLCITNSYIYLNDGLMHHAADEEVLFSCYPRKVSQIGEYLIHSKSLQMSFKVDALTAKSELGHVKHEALLRIGGLAEEFLERWQRRRIKKLR